MNVISRYFLAAWRGELSLLTAILANGIGGFAAFVVLGLLSAMTGIKAAVYAVIILYLVWLLWAFIGIVRSAARLARTGRSMVSRLTGAMIAIALFSGFLFLIARDFIRLPPHP
jgi:hypothetical protein